ncbi:hypothetical protein [Viridibacterium curvum]
MKQLLWRLVVLGMFAAMPLVSSGMTYTRFGDTLILSGPVETADIEQLKDQLVPEVRNLVFRGVSGRGGYEARHLADVVGSAKLTTVVHGQCSYMCVRMFLFGKQRMFSAGTRLEASFIDISASILAKTGQAADVDVQFFRSAADIPYRYLARYVFALDSEKGERPSLLVFHPDAKTSKGSFMGCEKGDFIPACDALSDVDALSVGIITTRERFTHPGLQELDEIKVPAPSGVADLQDRPAVPTLSDNCAGKRYETFLRMEKPRAFVVSKAGGCYSADAQDILPYRQAMEACQKKGKDCRFYAVDDAVVFKPY